MTVGVAGAAGLVFAVFVAVMTAVLRPLALTASAQIWRYRAVSGSTERRQIRWPVFGFGGMSTS
jgi:hypothetical protein